MGRRPHYVVGFLLALVGCTQDFDATSVQAELDERYFECKVQPVLTKSCSMFACHGDGRRIFRVFARNRLRWTGTEEDRNQPLRGDELRMNYLAARAMVSSAHPADSLLLRKPLEEREGGYYHEGAETFHMGNVYADAEDNDYQILEKWVNRATWQDDPRCITLFATETDGGPGDAMP